MLKSILVALWLSTVFLFAMAGAVRSPAQSQEVIAGPLPACEPAAKVIADFRAQTGLKVEARIFTKDEIRKLAGAAGAEGASIPDTAAVIYFNEQAVLLYGNGGVVCNFALGDAAPTRKFIDDTLGGRRAHSN